MGFLNLLIKIVKPFIEEIACWILDTKSSKKVEKSGLLILYILPSTPISTVLSGLGLRFKWKFLNKGILILQGNEKGK